ncbi:uncharacterized protein LOC124775307 [Schistocerca piceifrons]|uniref:uncharacterized protein LOC124775307 n=1 Tax=Schistocerca piceifrons TaxID=274613 RepID=UPI001F5F159F|nr:uncharacterized protein LOC124775307 [Schistocerca piceifrons]
MLALLLLTIATSVRTAAGLECPLTPKNVSCSDQMPHLDLDPEDCIVEYYLRNSNECAALDLRGESWARRLGAVRMRPYVWTDDEGTPVTAFNVSFLDVRWSRAVLRFSSLGGAPATNFCRGLRLSQRALSGSGRPPRLHFHCPWCGYDCEGRSFSLEYAASDADGRHRDYGRFLFTMPPHNYVDEPQLPFSYVEVSSLPTAHVHWSPPPLPSAAEGLYYSVVTLVDGRQVESRVVPASQASLALPLGEASGGGGAVRFSVRALQAGGGEPSLLPNCSLCDGGERAALMPSNCSLCDSFRTPPLALERSVYTSYVWAAVGVVAMASAILLTGRFLWRRGAHNYPANKQGKAATTVLLVYRHASDGHVGVVRQLADFLRVAGGFHVLLDEEDIPRCADKNPLAWYAEQMQRADVALVVASPEPLPTTAPASAPAAGVYGGAAAAAEALVGVRLERGRRCEALALPGRPHLPPPARALRLLRARRPSDLRRLVRRLHPGGGLGPAVRSAASRTAALALLRIAHETVEDCPPQQANPGVAIDVSSSDLPEEHEPVYASESSVTPTVRQQALPTVAVSTLVDLQKMNLLGPDLSEEDTEEEEGDGSVIGTDVSGSTSGVDPDSISLQL